MYTTEAQANKRAAALQKRLAKEGTALEKNTQADFQAFLNRNKGYNSSTAGSSNKSNSVDASNITDYDPKSKLGKSKGYTTSKGRGFEQFDKNGNVIVSKKQKEAIEAELKKRQEKEAAELAAAKLAPLKKMKSLKNRWKWGAIGTGVAGAGATAAALLANRGRDDD